MLEGRARLLVSELERCQYALELAGQGGYLAAFPPCFFDRLEALQPVWVPYYTVRCLVPSAACSSRRADPCTALQPQLLRDSCKHPAVLSVPLPAKAVSQAIEP